MVRGLRSGGSALLFVGFSVPGEYNKPIWKSKIKLAVSTRRKTVEQSPGTVFMVCRAQWDHERTATCASVQGVPSQGTLDSRTTCGISEPPEQGGPAHTRQLAAMPNPASRRERRKLAAAAKAASTKPPQTCGGTTEGSTAALSTTPQDSGQIGDIVTLTGTTATGGAEADDRMDVAQSFSSSEAETSEEETVDEDTLLRSPLEQETETGTAPSCSAEAPTGGVATGHSLTHCCA